MGVGYESESGAGVVAPRLGGSIQVTLNKETISPAETPRQTLGANTAQVKKQECPCPIVELSENVKNEATVLTNTMFMCVCVYLPCI